MPTAAGCFEGSREWLSVLGVSGCRWFRSSGFNADAVKWPGGEVRRWVATLRGQRADSCERGERDTAHGKQKGRAGDGDRSPPPPKERRAWMRGGGKLVHTKKTLRGNQSSSCCWGGAEERKKQKRTVHAACVVSGAERGAGILGLLHPSRSPQRGAFDVAAVRTHNQHPNPSGGRASGSRSNN